MLRLALALGLGLLAFPTLAEDNASQAATQIKLITQFHEGHLGIGFAVTSEESGKCFAESAASSPLSLSF